MWGVVRHPSYMLRSLNLGSDELRRSFELGRDRVKFRVRLLGLMEG